MAIHKIQINDFVSDDYELIAVHSSLDDYKLAYMLNKELGVQLSKNLAYVEIAIPEGKSAFSNYIFDDEKNDVVWTLIENKTTIINSNKQTTSLFEQVDITVFLLPEFKKADYLIKIENIDYGFDSESIVDKIQEIKNVTTAYAIDITNLKSKNNLIF
ncbi:IPExxxVDY family protein [Flavobacterium sp. HXWNR29]|uniref:IPExxxVDY family protein n=1 Tax=Flavobacterium odoriferum TaxID=2946604 RepID=UPI0021CB2B6E|nr:IPExxxVDY family protein [Flavobacterium sp. HXWNR29]MCU4188052.1 IPExxxVDY family protein [Flavobacterium sp. HXWNR29]